MRLVIASAGRSGSGYISKLLTAAGVRCTHEEVFTPVGVDRARWREVDAESSWLAVPYLAKLPPNVHVVHQVRHPVDVIRSLMGIRMFAPPDENVHGAFHDFVASSLPALQEQPSEIERCMTFWVEWNSAAARSAGHTYRVEELTIDGLVDLVERAGGAADLGAAQRAVEAVPSNYNARRRDHEVTWASLPDGPLKERVGDLARTYGYQPEA